MRAITRRRTAARLPRVSVVLLNWNGVGDTLECIASLRKLTYRNHDIVVVDNGSEGNDLEVLRSEAADCHVIANGRNDGFAEGNNVGMRYALARGADYVLILNNDVVVDPGLLDVLVDAAERDESAGVLAPRICLYDEPARVVYPRAVDTWPLLLNFHLGALGVFDRITVKRRTGTVRVRSVDGCCFLARREALQEIGLLDPTYFIGGYESLCLSRRLLDQGYRMAAALDATIWAKVSGSLGSRRKAALTYAFWGPRNRVVFARRYLAWPHYLLFLLEMPVHMLLWAIAWGRQAKIAEKVPALLRGLWDGFRTDLGRPPGRTRAAPLKSKNAGTCAE